jgi:hypothetical protein
MESGAPRSQNWAVIGSAASIPKRRHIGEPYATMLQVANRYYLVPWPNSRLVAGSLNQFPLPTPSMIDRPCNILWSFSNFGKSFLYLLGRVLFAEVPLQPP